MDLPGALRAVHVIDETDVVDAINRLPKKSVIFDEFFCLESGIAQRKAGLRKESGISFNTDTKVVQKLLKNMPFSLTGAQEKVIEEIKDDMASPHPMNRLLQGDVGSGKTIVALISAIIAIDNGFQAALMAPTEILAEQHYITSHRYLDPIDISVALLTGSLSKSEKNAIIKNIKRGAIDFIVGTHAIIQKDLEFSALGFVVVDEQHRFGVTQRASLKKKGLNPDILVMTATPIPRTLAMTIFGDLDVSTIDELPPKRQQVVTKVFREGDRNRIYGIIKEELQSGRQAYIVYPLVEESQELELRDATNMKEKLQRDVFGDYRVGLLHGRMKGEEKEFIMREFKERKIDVLVATTVIEVGIDIQNATVMLVEHAERFGLAQLHQLRGRVGRGAHKSYCLLLAENIGSKDAYKRLKVIESVSDGFRLAEEDLKLRGPGDFFGTRQSGLPDFRVANPVNDIVLLQKAREEAFRIVKKDPFLSLPEHAATREIVNSRWKGRLELATVG
jgi:ATP-dependent DNA helicase RecG